MTNYKGEYARLSTSPGAFVARRVPVAGVLFEEISNQDRQ
jgi:hypothetical protein